ncbi:MAG: hypothetical protein II853_03905 [Prevotella sp.]|nr:hypothetical protein [Prevotella sp.]
MNFLLWFLLIMSFTASCKDQPAGSQWTDRIESVWQQSDTALDEACRRAALLGDALTGMTTYEQRRYEQLCIRLHDKQNIMPSSPDSTQQSLDYFLRHGSETDKERAYFYLARAYQGLKDYPRAVVNFMKGVEIIEDGEATDTVIWQYSLSQLRHLYALQLRYEDELDVALKAVALADRTKTFVGWYLMDVASAYKHLRDTLHCLLYCEKSYDAIRREHFPARYASILSHQLALYTSFGRLDHADTLLNVLLNFPPKDRPQNYELNLALYFEHLGQMDTAIAHFQQYYTQARRTESRYEAAAGLQRCFMKKGDYRKAARWGVGLYKANDSIIAQRDFEQTQRAREGFLYYRDKEAETALRQHEERIRLTAIAGFLFLSCLVMGLVVYYNARKRKLLEVIAGKEKSIASAKATISRRSEELERKKREVSLLEDELGKASRGLEDKERQLAATMKDLEQRVRINKELTRIALMSDAEEKADDVVDYFRKIAMGKEKMKPTAWKALDNAVEMLYPGFNEAVQGRLGGQLREPLLQTILLLKVGLKPAQIAKIMEAKMQTVWNRVKRAEETCGDLLHECLSSSINSQSL